MCYLWNCSFLLLIKQLTNTENEVNIIYRGTGRHSGLFCVSKSQTILLHSWDKVKIVPTPITRDTNTEVLFERPDQIIINTHLHHAHTQISLSTALGQYMSDFSVAVVEQEQNHIGFEQDLMFEKRRKERANLSTQQKDQT